MAARHPPNGRQPIGGVQSWSATVGDELRRRGHEVVYWGPGSPLNDRFDFGILANIGDTRPAQAMCKKHVAICHGIIAPEKPPLRSVAFTSEEVRDYWKGEGPIVRQPLDLAFWQPSECKKHLLVRFSYRFGLPFVSDIAARMGLGFQHVSNATPEQVREVLQQAICVVATGRAAVESMACGVPVVICDHREYQGPLMDPDTTGAMYRNYSGRNGIKPTESILEVAIHNAIDAGSLRAHAEKYHDVRKIAGDLLCYTC